MKIRRIRRVHFSFVRIDEQIHSSRIGHVASTREIIAKVYGASPAIVFDPLPPIASITRPMRKPNLGWQKFQAMQNGEGDHIRGYDDGECEPQSRGIH